MFTTGAALTAFFMDEQKYPNSVIYQHIEQVYMPAESWETCDKVLTDDEVYSVFSHLVESRFHLEQILNTLHFKRKFNEHNQKYYWLVKAVV